MSRPFESHNSRRVLFPGIIDQDLLSRRSRHLSPHRTSIHILDDDSLLHIFYHCRPVLFDDEQDEIEMCLTEGEEWLSERWWYKVAQVCRRWRVIILGSVSHLHLSLVCTYRTPVVDMLAHSPPLPLIIDHLDEIYDITDEDIKDILLVLQHRDRVRWIRLRMDVPVLRGLIKAIDGEFPMLEYLYIGIPASGNTRLILPKTFQAPYLQHLILDVAQYHIGSPLLTTATGIVTLLLGPIVPPHLPPKDLLVSLALLPQLEILGVGFLPPDFYGDRVKWQELLHRPITSHICDVTLPNLRWFMFLGLSEYLEALLPHVTTPLLEGFQSLFLHQLNISTIRVQQVKTVAAKHKFSCATLRIEEDSVSISVNPPKWNRMDTFYMKVDSRRIDLQLASLVQIANELRTVFYSVEDLTLKYWENSIASERHNEANREKWRELLRPFSNVKTLRLRMPKRLVVALARSLQLRDGESPMELLPELRQVIGIGCHGWLDRSDVKEGRFGEDQGWWRWERGVRRTGGDDEWVPTGVVWDLDLTGRCGSREDRVGITNTPICDGFLYATGGSPYSLLMRHVQQGTREKGWPAFLRESANEENLLPATLLSGYSSSFNLSICLERVAHVSVASPAPSPCLRARAAV